MEGDAKPELDSELEFFRRQWKSELQSKKPESSSQPKDSRKAKATASVPKPPHRSDPSSSTSPSHVRHKSQQDEDNDYVRPPVFDGPDGPSILSDEMVKSDALEKPGPISALDHFEEAAKKEAIGNLGESLKLYRKAFRMDDRVDLQYRKKHFPASAVKAAAPSTKPADIGAAAPAHNAKTESQPQTFKDLVASFSGLSIEPAGPPVEGDPAPPCPIADVPQEILSHILTDVAIDDVGDFARLSRVCKRFAYMVASENQIWRRVCLGRETGFAGMHYDWQTGIQWEPLDEDDEISDDGTVTTAAALARRREADKLAATMALFPAYASSWQHMFRHRPRVRFNGCYISTVNYIRAGQASANAVTWGSPVHIITYYRYLRFFRDGTVISLLTTSEPGDVVHHLTKEALALHQGGAVAHLPSIVMVDGLRGRWRLTSADDEAEAEPPVSAKDAEAGLVIETEGVIDKYTYRMDLSVRSAGKGARNTKVVWKGLYSHNKLTDDWAEFGLKNDKAFFFSRVRGYRAGA
ncbi:hypothetical protein BN1723_002135 [Verticillium longisporum]|uniref:F-box domain-containing protein n=1 Tax=Verticillium longisporum TaxID=100787 RepID=A0A0G4KYW3_VERLO|nr:hypothetical protein BN1723_002135 [Verticillium longisporum]CRK37739.1 hypothetical protein BN1708_007476 [Verticillium longisporum]